MTDLSLTLVLSYASGRIRGLELAASELLEDAEETSRDLADLRERVGSLKEELGFGFQPSSTTHAPPRSGSAKAEPAGWEELVAEADRWLAAKHHDLDLDQLLRTEQQAKRIDDQHGGTFSGQVKLDPYDIAAAVTAGVAGAFADLLVVKSPSGGMWDGEWQSGSRLTFGLRRNAVDVDNWLSGLFKAPFDRVNETGISGMGPRSHRVQTFGHDPLLGWALGTLDIMRGTLTGVDMTSEVHVIESGQATPDLFAALGLQAGHLLSDVFTRMGLPLPGWTALLTIPFGEFGPDNRTVGQMARWMYLRGYGTWHLLTMSSSVAVTEAVIRAYYSLRQLLDDDYKHAVEVEGIRSQAKKVTDEPRYQSLSLLAHSIAAAGNAGKIALYGGNPLALNIAQWAMLARRVVQRTQVQPISETLVNQHTANITTIHTGWANLGLDVSESVDV